MVPCPYHSMNQSLNELRATLKRRQRAAGQKISRNSRQGVKLAGSKYDPRVPADKIDRYNRTQLQAQLNRVNQFTSRKTQFVAVHGGAPLPRQQWERYKATEQKAAENMEATLAKFDSIVLPSSETVAQRRARTQVKHRTAANPAVNVPDAPPSRQPHNLKSPKAVRKLVADLKKKTGRGWINTAARKDRVEAGAMLAVLNQPDLTAKVADLTNAQFYLLWNFTNFAENISAVYVSANKELEDQEDFDETIIADNLKEAGDWVEWASKIKVRR